MSGTLKFAGGLVFACIVGAGTIGGKLGDTVASGRSDVAVTRSAPTAPASTGSTGGSTVLAADRRGHFLATPTIEGAFVNALVDTGASMVALSWEDAQRIGLRPDANAPRGIASTANGNVPFTVVRLREVRLNGIVVHDVEGAIMPKGALQNTLLGMSFLKRLSSFEMRDNKLMLKQ